MSRQSDVSRHLRIHDPDVEFVFVFFFPVIAYSFRFDALYLFIYFLIGIKSCLVHGMVVFFGRFKNQT